MKIELNNLDGQYTIEIDAKEDMLSFIRIESYSKDKTICLDKEGMKQLIRTLNFLGQEMQ